jgi:hypothetical protein
MILDVILINQTNFHGKTNLIGHCYTVKKAKKCLEKLLWYL